MITLRVIIVIIVVIILVFGVVVIIITTIIITVMVLSLILKSYAQRGDEDVQLHSLLGRFITQLGMSIRYQNVLLLIGIQFAYYFIQLVLRLARAAPNLITATTAARIFGCPPP